jgi:tetratricopeptide (TPR) repeat protein
MPRTRTLAAGLLCLLFPAGAHADDWIEAKSPHFLVVGNVGEKEAAEVAQQFERFREVLHQATEVRLDPGRPFTILAVGDEGSMKAAMPGAWEKKGGARPAGVFVPGLDRHYAVVRTDLREQNPYHVLYHEYVHLVNRLNFRWLPKWLDEGLADYYSAADISDRAVIWGRLHAWHVRLLREKPLLPLDVLFAVDHGSPEYNESNRVSMFYAESAILTDYLMLSDPAHRDRVIQYLKLLDQDVDEAEARHRAFGDFKALEKGFSEYVRRFLVQGAKQDLFPSNVDVPTRKLRPSEAAAVRADFLVHTGRRQEAEQLLTDALRAEPGVALAHEARGLIEMSEGNRDAAAASFREAVRLDPQDSVAHYYVATARNTADAPADAEAELRKCLALAPIFAPAHAALATLLLDMGRVDDALLSARRAYDLEPNETRNALVLIRVLEKKGATAQAAIVEKRVLRAARTDPVAMHALVAFYESQNRRADEEALLQAFSETHPKDASGARHLAIALMRQKRYDEAEAAFRKALEIHPDDATALNDLGYMNADRGVRVEEALQLIDKALALKPGEASFLDSRGWALNRLGRLDEAEASVRQALAKRDNAAIRDHLGDILAKRGHGSEAAAEWRRVLGMSALDGERKTAIEKKLAEVADK